MEDPFNWKVSSDENGIRVMKRSQDLIRDSVLDSEEELNRRMQTFCTLLNLLDLWETFGSGRLCYFKVSEHSDININDMLLHSEWVLFEWHV